jgi:hypothetical protein
MDQWERALHKAEGRLGQEREKQEVPAQQEGMDNWYGMC